MKQDNIFAVLLFVSVLFEFTLIPFPLTFITATVFYILDPKVKTIILASTAGLLVDILNVSVLSQTTLSILVSYLLIDLYKRAFEIKDWRVFLLILLANTFIYAKVTKLYG